MALQHKNIIIIGAAGNLGSALLSAFEADSRFTISVLSRHSSQSTFPSHIKVHKVADDYPETDLVAAFSGQDAIISAIAAQSTSQQKGFIDAALKAGVKRFVPAEFGSDPLNEKGNALLGPLLDPKAAILEYLKTKEDAGLTWTAFATGPFFEPAVKRGLMGFDIAARKATVYNDGNGAWSTTKMSTIALAVKNAMLIPDQTANKFLLISSTTVSSNQVIASLERATGEKFEVTHVDAEEQKRIGMEKMSKGDFSGVLMLIKYLNTVEGYGGNFASYRETANVLLSLPEEDLDSMVVEICRD
ncbi:MAG: hypothetical protein M1822_003314 [Bathelium mastoideum]|nr:MAG: hypothetical protein M1822_003314 [Bathelium mastoideum]